MTGPAATILSGAADTAAIGADFEVHVWTGSGAGFLHVHDEDDEAWHVLSGKLKFRFADGTRDAGPGDTVFVPKGCVHDYETLEPSSYLMILTPRLRRMIDALHAAPPDAFPDILAAHATRMVE